jgi:phenylacetate-CoA ligase
MNNFKDAGLTVAGILYGDTFLRRTEFWDEESRNKYQRQKLRKLFVECNKNISWYRNAFKNMQCDPVHDSVIDIYNYLPILDKNTVRENIDKFVNNKIKNVIKFETSGTSGEPLTVNTHAHQWVNEQGVIWRAWRRAGFVLGDKVAIFRSYTPKKSDSPIKIDRIRNWAYLSIYHTDEENLEKYADFLTHWKPKYLRGYPSSILLLSKYLKDKNIIIPTLKAAFTASEMLSSSTRQQIYENIGLEVFDHYGQAEITAMFHDCEKHEGMHYDWEYGRVDLMPSAASGLYKIVATNLHNRAMPLLKYDTGDLSNGEFLKCSCHRTSPILKNIIGRDIDFIVNSDESKIPAVNFYTHFSKIKLAKRIQLIQERRGVISVRFESWIPANRIAAQHELELLSLKLSNTIGLTINVEPDKSIVFSKSGKEKFIIQKLKNDI